MTTQASAVLQHDRVGGRSVHLVASHGDRLRAWNARWHRKARSGDRTLAAVRRQQALAWSLGGLFAVGSVLFIVAGPLALLGLGGSATLNLVGSVLFSVGAVLAVLEAAGGARPMVAPGTGRVAALWTTVAGKASVVQLVAAAVVFQISTVADALDASGAVAFWAVWVPSVLGGVGFVWSGRLYLVEAAPAHDIGTRVASANLVGSWLFLVAALPGLVDPDRTQSWTHPAVDVGYTLGSVAFLLGGIGAIVEVSRPLGAHCFRFPEHPPEVIS